MAKNQPEFVFQQNLCSFIRSQYPKALFMTDTIAALKLTMGQKQRNKTVQKEGFHTPDLILFEPRGQYHGLLMELKVDTPWKLNGEIKASKDDRLKKQWATICDLRSRGFYADFIWEFEQARALLAWYMKL